MDNSEKPKEQKEQISPEELKRKLWDEDYLDSEKSSKAVDFARKLKAKYPDDYMNYRLWYILAGGSPDYQGEEKYDFPGEDSIEKFINSLE